MKDMGKCITWIYSILETSPKRHDDVIKWKHFPRYRPFVRRIHRSPMNSLHKGQWRGALMFPLICAWSNSWANNREAGDLRRHRAHYDVTVMRNTKQYSVHTWWDILYDPIFGPLLWRHVSAMASKITNHMTVFFLRLVQVNINENIKAKHRWPFVIGIYQSRWISPKNVFNAESAPMLWRCNAFLAEVPVFPKQKTLLPRPTYLLDIKWRLIIEKITPPTKGEIVGIAHRLGQLKKNNSFILHKIVILL